MRRLLAIWMMALMAGFLSLPLGAQAQACDACGKRVDSLDKPVKLAGTWLFTRDDAPQNALPGQDTSQWKVIKAPGPWKKAYDDKLVYPIGWYRGTLDFAPELVGQEVVLLLNTYMAKMEVFANGQSVYARPRNDNVERYYSIQAAPVRFKITQPQMLIAIRVDTPLMTGVYQLPFELHRYDRYDGTLVGWALWGGEVRSVLGWVAFFFGLFFLLVFSKTQYPLYLVAALGSIFGCVFLVTPADYFAALVPIRTLTYLHYTGLSGVFFFFLFSQFFYKFTPKLNVAFGLLLAIPALGVASMALHENLVIFQLLRSVFFVLLLGVSLTTVYFYFRGVLLKKPGAKTMLTGMLLFTMGSVNDTMLGLGIIQSFSLAATALSLCLAAMLYVSVQSFANTFIENKRLVGDLRDINENLEGLVAQRTQALREKTNDIQAMLQNMPQGVATVTAGGKLHPEYSAYLETIFETDKVAGRDAMEFLFGKAALGADARDQLQVAMASTLGEDRMNFDFNSHLLVSEVDVNLAGGARKSLEFSWSPIVDEQDNVEKLMVCVRDVTELKRLAAESAGQKRELELIGEILAVSQEKFQAFIESANGFIVENRQVIEAQAGREVEAVNLLFRNMHTVKGNARTYGLLHLTNTVHETEQAYDLLRKDAQTPWQPEMLLAQLDDVQERVAEYARINDHTLGRKGPGRRGGVEKFLMVDRQELAGTLQSLRQVDRASLEAMRNAVDEAERTLRRVGTEPLHEALSSLIDGLPSLARELGKEAPLMHIEDGGLRVKSQLSGLLRNLFTHLLRNAVDHGLETPAEREVAGKGAQGRISLSAQLANGHFEMRLRDDGRGLALQKIRERALERGLISADQVLGDQQIADLIFLPGFSTAETVTEVSGRGVGMDAVRDFLQRESGSIAVHFVDGGPGASGYRAAELVIQLPAAAAVVA